MRVSRKKRSSREDYMLHEQLKIEEGIFDNRTMVRISKLFGKGIITRFHFRIATGKEADVYLADPGKEVNDDYVVLKIFRIETTSFKDRMGYITGDPRFGKIKSDLYSVVNVWCKKEYGNLSLALMAGARAPRPYAFSGNVLAMEFIGEDGKPSPRLKDVEVKDPGRVLDLIIDDVRKLYENGLVHADLSEYNVLMLKGMPYLIDFGQAVVLEHERAVEYLHRDITNILVYFDKRYGVKKDEKEVFGLVTKAKEGKKKKK